MKTRLVLKLLTICALFGAGAVGAQQAGSVAKLSDLEGNVLVSQGDAMVAAAGDQRVAAGARVVTMAGGKVLIRYDNGCDVALKENQRFTVRIGECPLLLSEVVSLGPAPGATVAAGVTTTTVIGTVGLGMFGYAAYEFFRNKSVSPN